MADPSGLATTDDSCSGSLSAMCGAVMPWRLVGSPWASGDAGGRETFLALEDGRDHAITVPPHPGLPGRHEGMGVGFEDRGHHTTTVDGDDYLPLEDEFAHLCPIPSVPCLATNVTLPGVIGGRRPGWRLPVY